MYIILLAILVITGVIFTFSDIGWLNLIIGSDVGKIVKPILWDEIIRVETLKLTYKENIRYFRFFFADDTTFIYYFY